MGAGFCSLNCKIHYIEVCYNRGLTVLYSLLGLLIYLSYDLSTLLLVSYLSTLEPDYTFEGSSTGEYRCKEAELAD